MRKLWAIALSAVMVLTMAACGGNSDSGAGSTSTAGSTDSQAQEKVLNIFTWEGYISQGVIEDFKAQTGVTVNYSTFMTNEDMIEKLKASPNTYDLILASDYIIEQAIQENLAAELDTKIVTNLGNINDNYKKQYYDPEDKYSVAYTAGVPLIIYDPSKVDFEITGYADLWNEKLKDSIVVMDDPRNVIGMTLRTMGKSLNETDEKVLNEAKEKLLPLRENIRAFDYDTPHVKLVNGEVSVGYMFTSQANTALLENPNLKVVFPKEGLGFGIDALFVAKDAPHKDIAMEFINYLLTPEVAAKTAEEQLYINPNKASESLFKGAEQLVTAVPEGSFDNAEMMKNVGDAAEIYNTIWTEFKQQ